MASITIRNLDDEVKHRLRLRAVLRGHSMEEEARAILRRTLLDCSFAAAVLPPDQDEMLDIEPLSAVSEPP